MIRLLRCRYFAYEFLISTKLVYASRSLKRLFPWIIVEHKDAGIASAKADAIRKFGLLI
jgi:hypothetical protein